MVWRIIVVQKTRVDGPLFRPLLMNICAQTTHNTQIVFLVDGFSGQKVLEVHDTSVIEETYQHTLEF